MPAISRLLSILFFAWVAVAAAWLVRNPALNWDMLPYVGVMESRSATDPATIHARVYDNLPRHANDKQLERLVDSTAYRRVCATDPEAFAQQLVLYSIRPLYWGLALVLATTLGSVGVDPFVATYLVSAMSYSAVCAMCFLYLRRRTGPVFALAGAFALSLYPTLWKMGIASLPDLLLAAFVLGGFILLAEGRIVWSAAVLFVAVFVRTDVAVYNLLLGGLLALQQIPRPRKIAAVGLLAGSALAAAAVHAWFDYYGWATIFHFSLVERLTHPADTAVSISPEIYFGAVASEAAQLLRQPWLWGAAASAAVYAILSERGRESARGRDGLRALTRLRPENVALVAFGLYLMVRFLIFPNLLPRFVLGQNLGLLLVALIALYDGWWRVHPAARADIMTGPA